MSEETEKSISLDSARLYRLHGIQVAILQAGTEVSYLNPIEIRSGDRRLGWASIREEAFGTSKMIRADMVFSYETPERLSIETGSENLYARLEGIISLGVEPFEIVGLLHGLLPEVKDMTILGLEISRTPGFEGQSHLGEASFL